MQVYIKKKTLNFKILKKMHVLQKKLKKCKEIQFYSEMSIHLLLIFITLANLVVNLKYG